MFDESHKAKNLLPSTGTSKPSQMGEAVATLQRMLPNAKVVYCSATGVSEPRNLGTFRCAGWGAQRQSHAQQARKAPPRSSLSRSHLTPRAALVLLLAAAAARSPPPVRPLPSFFSPRGGGPRGGALPPPCGRQRTWSGSRCGAARKRRSPARTCAACSRWKKDEMPSAFLPAWPIALLFCFKRLPQCAVSGHRAARRRRDGGSFCIVAARGGARSRRARATRPCGCGARRHPRLRLRG